MAALYQRSSDRRWIARIHVPNGFRYVTGADREDVVRRASVIEESGRAPEPPKGDPRFWSKVIIGANCWLWTGFKDNAAGGYGQYRVGKRIQRAHRVAYEMVVGPIPDGLTIDHLCKNPWCVNPTHMEPVPIQENLRRRYRIGVGTQPIAERAA